MDDGEYRGLLQVLAQAARSHDDMHNDGATGAGTCFVRFSNFLLL